MKISEFEGEDSSAGNGSEYECGRRRRTQRPRILGIKDRRYLIVAHYLACNICMNVIDVSCLRFGPSRSMDISQPSCPRQAPANEAKRETMARRRRTPTHEEESQVAELLLTRSTGELEVHTLNIIFSSSPGA